MKVTKNYDSEFCGRLPLHQINLIQDYGWLIVVRKTNSVIIQVSENAEELIGSHLDEIVGADIGKYADEKLQSVLRKKTDTGITQKIPVAFNLKTKTGATVPMLAVIHTKADHLILELEKVSDKTKRSFLEMYEQISFVTAQLQVAVTPADVCKIGVKELKRVSGFEKVMIYQFDEQWNGSVLAEEGDDGLPKYLGLKFPASDVPKQARDLYLKNSYRLIPDRNYTPVRLYPVINPMTNGFVDLSDCNLRGVAAVHVEYLGNMGVTASMSLRILRDGKLWGLIACHHRQPTYLDFEQCAMLEMISDFISERITSLLNKEHFDATALLQNQKTDMIGSVYASNDVTEGLLQKPNNLLSLFNAGGAAVVMNRKISLTGATPDKNEIENIIYWLQSRNQKSVFAASAFSNEYEQSAEYSELVSGIIAIPIRPENGDYVLVFRPEVLQTVNWGGNPDEAIQFETDKTKYHPRNSFEQWKQTLVKTAIPWSEQELTIAEQLRSSLYEFSTRALLN